MVGMPYPNIKSPELQEKIAYLDKHMVSDKASEGFFYYDVLYVKSFLSLSATC